jgi:hypothetical protein
MYLREGSDKNMDQSNNYYFASFRCDSVFFNGVSSASLDSMIQWCDANDMKSEDCVIIDGFLFFNILSTRPDGSHFLRDHVRSKLFHTWKMYQDKDYYSDLCACVQQMLNSIHYLE